MRAASCKRAQEVEGAGAGAGGEVWGGLGPELCRVLKLGTPAEGGPAGKGTTAGACEHRWWLVTDHIARPSHAHDVCRSSSPPPR